MRENRAPLEEALALRIPLRVCFVQLSYYVELASLEQKKNFDANSDPCDKRSPFSIQLRGVQRCTSDLDHGHHVRNTCQCILITGGSDAIDVELSLML